jgi:hypothetical protein
LALKAGLNKLRLCRTFVDGQAILRINTRDFDGCFSMIDRNFGVNQVGGNHLHR